MAEIDPNATTDSQGNLTWGNNWDTYGSNSGSGGGFDWNNLANSLFQAVGPILGGASQLYNATHNQQQLQPNLSALQQQQQQQQQQQKSSNTWLYVGLGVFFLLLMLAVIFFAVRKTK